MLVRQRRKRRYRRFQGLDLFRGLGPGDPGYRLRPGVSGLDPMESYMEQGRVLGLLLKSLWQGRSQAWQVPSMFLLYAGVVVVIFRFQFLTHSVVKVGPITTMAIPLVAVLAVLLIGSLRAIAIRPSGEA